MPSRRRCGPPARSSGRGRRWRRRRRRAAARRRTPNSPAAAEMPERAPGQQRSDTRGKGARQLLAEKRFHRVHQPFADLQRHVPGESIADDDVRHAAVDIAGLDVPDEAERRCLEQAVRFARQLVALAFLLADREQPHARRRQAEADARVDAAHDGELQQVLGPALDAGADVEQDGGMPACRDGDCERRPIDARQHPEGAVCRDNRRAGVTRAEERGRLPAGDQPGCDGDRRVRACGAAPRPAHRTSRSPRCASITCTRVRSTSACRAISASIGPVGPTSATPRSKCRAAASAPSTT